MRARSSAWGATALTAIVFCLMALLSRCIPADPAVVAKKFTDLHIAAYGMYDSSAQRMAHKAALAILVFIFLLGLARKSDWITAYPNIWGLCAILLALTSYMYVYFPLLFLWQASIIGFLLAISYMPRKYSRRMGFIWGIFILAMLAYYLTPGLSGVFDLSSLDAGGWEWVSMHHSMVVGPADRVAYGFHLGGQVHADYGLLMPVLLGGWEKRFGILSLGGHIKLIQAMQILYCLLTLVGLYLWKRDLLSVCLSLLVVVPWFYPGNLLLEVPNQTAWRVLGLAATPIAIYWGSKSAASWRAFLLGLMAGIFLLFNLETGLVSATGLGLLAWMDRRGDQRSAIVQYGKMFLLFFGGVGGSVAGFIGLHRLCLGYWPGLGLARSYAQMMKEFASGFCGLEFHFDLVAAVIFLHSFYTFASIVLRETAWRHKAMRARAAIAFVILIWFAYYANRPADLNLDAYYALYAFLAMDVLLFKMRGMMRNNLSWVARNAATAMILAALVPVTLRANMDAVARIEKLGREKQAAKKKRTDAVVISGVFMRNDMADMLKQKADFIRSEAAVAGHPLVYITSHSELIPLLSGVYPDIPFGDAFGDSRTREDYDYLVSWIRSSPYGDKVYFDQFPARPHYKSIQDRLKSDLGLTARGTAQGWEIYTRH